MNQPSTEQPLVYYPVWDRPTRCFHWINVICVVALAAVGLVLLNDDALKIGKDGKLVLKTVHAGIGYVFAVNLVWRLLWAFFGNRYARWRSLLPVGTGFWRAMREYVAGASAGDPPGYLGHNPVARLMVALLFLLLVAQATTGLVLAGTDLYFPPFGHEIAQWVSASSDQAAVDSLQPGSRDGVDAAAFEDMRNFRKPFAITHVYVFYVLIVAIVLHVAAVVLTEIREMNGIVSAMFTGKKVMSRRPVDLD